MAFDVFREFLLNYQKVIRATQRNSISVIVANNCHSPSASFGIINSVINSSSAPPLVASKAMCENLLKFFVDRIAYIRSHIIPPVTDPSTYVAFDHFMRIFLTAE